VHFQVRTRVLPSLAHHFECCKVKSWCTLSYTIEFIVHLCFVLHFALTARQPLGSDAIVVEYPNQQVYGVSSGISKLPKTMREPSGHHVIAGIYHIVGVLTITTVTTSTTSIQAHHVTHIDSLLNQSPPKRTTLHIRIFHASHP